MSRNNPLFRWTSVLALVVVMLACGASADLGGAQDTPPDASTPAADAPSDADTAADTTTADVADESTDGDTASADAGAGTADLPGGPESPAEAPLTAPVAPAEDDSTGMPWYVALAAVLGTLVLPLIVGTAIAKRVRMPEIAWKINLALVTITAGAVICWSGQVKLGPDLSGGILLIYELEALPDDDGEAGSDDSDVLEKMIAAVRRRVDPSGVKEVTIRRYGPNQIEIMIPKVGPDELAETMRKISTAGALEFRITANRQDHADVIAAALNSPAKTVRIGDQVKARWLEIDTDEFDLTDPGVTNSYIFRQDSEGRTEALVMTDLFNVTGEYLSRTGKGLDDNGRLCVNFTFKGAGPRKFGALTGANVPNPTTGFRRHLGIVLDDVLISAPTINSVITDSGQISGNFTQEEVDFLIEILTAGSLPAKLAKEPISRQTMSPVLGADMIAKGQQAILISIVVVLLFMLLYYRFAGIIACLALAVNLVLIMGVMISLKAAFTLPGLAGLVLTIGMAVDANVLIFERIREELDRGAALRMAIRNGFGRATTTIVDANVTTLIIGVILYAVASDQIKGFAVTLILGILMSMYTAIFCSRIIFDIAERRRWITKLSMSRLVGKTAINFVGRRHVAAVASLSVITVGLAGVVMRGNNLLDIDFTGGSSVTIMLKQGDTLGIAEARRLVNEAPGLEDAAVVEVDVDLEEGKQHAQFNINAGGSELSAIQDKLEGIFGDRLEHYSLQFEPPTPIIGGSAATFDQGTDSQSRIRQVGFNQDEPATGDSTADEATAGEADDTAAADGDDSAALEAEDSPATGNAAEDTTAEAEESTDTDDVASATDPFAGGAFTTLTFGQPISHDSLEERIRELLDAAGHEDAIFVVSNVDHRQGSALRFPNWDLKTSISPDETSSLLEQLSEQFASVPVFPSSSEIGGKVAGDAQAMAAVAMLLSLVCLVGYIWIRFQRVMFGLAAVVALVHDVLITLGVLALSYFLVTYAEPAAAALLIDPFKISLPIVAAFLVIIGYSLNDTIVVFDRIREVRGKSPNLTEEMINTSINQTLGRTLLTSLTTLIVVVILYFFGGKGIHGFAFALIVGVLVGTYSSIFVASPVLLWMSKSGERAAARAKRT